MGNSVDVSYTNGVPQAEVEKITNKYQNYRYSKLKNNNNVF